MQKRIFTKASVSAGALFVLGNAVMVFPLKNGDEFTPLGISISFIIGIILYILAIPFYNFLLNCRYNNMPIKILKCLSFLIIILFSVFIAADVFKTFTKFISEIILPKTPLWLIAITLGAVVIYFITKRQEDFLKFSLICFVFVMVAVIAFFLLSLGDYNWENLKISHFPDFKKLIENTKPYILNPAIHSLLLPLYYKLIFKKEKISGHMGYILGISLLSVCILSVILLFGTKLSCRLSFPYASAISTISVGRLYTRLDGFSYFIYFASSIIKINICSFIAISCIKKIEKIIDGKQADI